MHSNSQLDLTESVDDRRKTPRPAGPTDIQSDLTKVGDSYVIDLDLNHGLALKEDGMSLAAMNKAELLETARDVAEDIALRRGEVTIDDVRYKMQIPKTQTNKANWIGSIFRDSRFVWTKKVKPSAIPSNHGRMIKIWTTRKESQ